MTCWGENASRPARDRRHDDRARARLRRSCSTTASCPQKLVLGNEHTCAVSADGRIKCWGSDQQGQLGARRDGRSARAGARLAPARPRRADARGRRRSHLRDPRGRRAQVLGAQQRRSARSRRRHNRGDGPGQMGDSLRRGRGWAAAPSPSRPARRTPARSPRTARVTCWGAGDAGQLGHGTPPARSLPPSPARRAARRGDRGRGRRRLFVRAARERPGRSAGAGARAASSARATSRTTPAPAAADRVRGEGDARWRRGAARLRAARERPIACWGANDSGQLGLGDTTRTGCSRPSTVGAHRRRVRGVAAGGDTTCVLLDDGAVKCWGANDRGQLGLGRRDGRAHVPPAQPSISARGAARRRSPSAAPSPARCSTRSRRSAGATIAPMQLGAPLARPGVRRRPERDGRLPGRRRPGRRPLAARHRRRARARLRVLDTGDVRCWGDNSVRPARRRRRRRTLLTVEPDRRRRSREQ